MIILVSHHLQNNIAKISERERKKQRPDIPTSARRFVIGSLNQDYGVLTESEDGSHRLV